MFFRKRKTIRCHASVLFQVIDEELTKGICCDIQFIYQKEKHAIGVYGDDRDTYDNVRFYFDHNEYESMQELIRNAKIGKNKLSDMDIMVEVTECDGCYPDITPALRAFIQTNSYPEAWRGRR